MDSLSKNLAISDYLHLLKPRKRDAHKGDFGHVLVIGGDYGMPGAVRMAAEAAARTGAGLVTVATRPEHIATVTATRPELLCYGIRKARDLLPLQKRATVIILGPGLGQTAWSNQIFNFTLKFQQPKIIDADALNLLAQSPQQADNWILTPHPGEAARLLKCDTTTIQQGRLAAAQALHTLYKGVIVLKGAGTIICADPLNPGICHAGNPGMATGGMGDVLSGILGGLVAQGLSLQQASELGVCLHAVAGDMAAKNGERGLLASDLLPYLHKLVNSDK